MPNNPIAFTLVIALAAAPLPSLAANSATQFITDAIKGDNSEMALGGLALGRGTTLAVRDFGLTLITDHRKAKIGAVELAKKHQISVPTEMMDEAKAELQKLLSLQGRAFDDEFARYMVDDHVKDVSDFAEEAKTKDDVGTYAAKILPVLKKHLKIAQDLTSQESSSKESSAASSSSAPSSAM